MILRTQLRMVTNMMDNKTKEALCKFGDAVLDTAIAITACLIFAIVLFLGLSIAGVIDVSGHERTDQVVKVVEYSSNISDDALSAEYYSSELGYVDGGMRKSTVNCYRYVGTDITVIDKYTNSVGVVHVITCDDVNLYVIVEENNDTYLFKSPYTYTEYRGK